MTPTSHGNRSRRMIGTGKVFTAADPGQGFKITGSRAMTEAEIQLAKTRREEGWAWTEIARKMFRETGVGWSPTAVHHAVNRMSEKETPNG